MRRTKRTLRDMEPLSKEICKVANELDRANRRLVSLAQRVHQIEFDAATMQSFAMKIGRKEKREENEILS